MLVKTKFDSLAFSFNSVRVNLLEKSKMDLDFYPGAMWG